MYQTIYQQIISRYVKSIGNINQCIKTWAFDSGFNYANMFSCHVKLLSKSNSIENQKELIQRYISHKESLQNLPVMDFVDDGYTGSNFDRPGFQQMMDGVRSGKIDTIIVKDLSRFGRDYISVGEYMEQIFPLLGVRLFHKFP